MNTPTVWTSEKLDDNTVRFVSDTTFGGSIVVTATKETAAGGPRIVWDKPDDVPFFVQERAEHLLGFPIG